MIVKAPSDSPAAQAPALPKSPTGIAGLDQVTEGGLPAGRPTLVCGGPGCGKTLLGMEFLTRGVREYGETGAVISFEETPAELATNVASLGFDIDKLVAENKLAFDHVRIDRAEIEETGAFNLEGLFVRIAYAVERVGAKRVLLDTVESLFSSLRDDVTVRSELRRLFAWLKDRGLTAVVTGELGEHTLTRNGLEEYVSDCVIFLDHRIEEGVSTRRMRIVKYRGTYHGTNEYPFLISRSGFTVVPITSVTLDHPASTERISSGIARLDAMLGGGGFFRGSSMLVSGSAGTGKTTFAAAFADAACNRGERCLWFGFEESPAQIVRNMSSVGFDLGGWTERGLLRIQSARPTSGGLEAHLAAVHRSLDEFPPAAVVVDPVSNLESVAPHHEVKRILLQLVDLLKARGITTMFTALTTVEVEDTAAGVSSLMDAWVLLRNHEVNGERNRLLFLLKSRGMAHSNQVREFVLTDHGVELTDVALSPQGVLTGSARLTREATERADAVVREQEFAVRQRRLERHRRTVEAQIVALRAEVEDEEDEARRAAAVEQQRVETAGVEQQAMARLRHSDDAESDDGVGPDAKRVATSQGRGPAGRGGTRG